MIAVLDTGSVSALSPVNERNRARLRALRQHVNDLTMPAAVLAEGLLTGHPGRDHHLRRLLEIVDITAVGTTLGYAAGSLRTQATAGGIDPPPSAIDAVVVAFADARAASDDVVIITSDPDDIEALAVGADNAQRLSIRSV